MNKSLTELKLTLLNIGYANLNATWNFDNVLSPFSRLYYIISGEAKVYHNQQTFILKPGYLYLIPSFTYHRCICETNMEQYFIHFLEELGHGLSIFNIKQFVYEIEADPFDKISFERILDINPNRGLVNDDPKNYDNRNSMLHFAERNESVNARYFLETQGILKVLLSRFIEEKKASGDHQLVKTRKIIDTLHYISENLSGELTVEQLAKFNFINADYFSRIFKEQMGIRPLEYIQSKRIERAQLLLTTTDYSLQEIADLVGLPNISYFSRLFTRTTKKTPAAYRRELWNS